MASIDVSAACVGLELDASLDGLAIIFPGGASFEIPTPPGIDVAFAIDYAKQILAGVSAALMPLQPIFNLIDIIMLIIDFLKAIPDSITGLDPSKLFDILPKLLAKLDKILAMIPPLSIPIFLKSLLKVIVVMLKGVQAALRAIIKAIIEASLPELRAAELEADFPEIAIQLRAAAECAKASAKLSMGALGQGLKPLDSLLKIIKIFVELIGLPVKIPTLADLGEEAEIAVDAIGILITVLETIGLAIPV